MDYFLCTTPRAGSNLLGVLLNQTRVAGNPREFLCPSEVELLGSKLCGFGSLEQGARQLSRYYQVVREQYRLGGHFGLKLHYGQFQWALDQGFDLLEFFPQRMLYLTRGDLVAQAISRVRARQTGAWISRTAEEATPSYDPDLISRAVQELVLENQAWETFFKAVDAEPYRLTYERLCSGFHEELGSVLRFLGVDPIGADILGAVERATGNLRLQRDGTNAEWHRRYREYLSARAQEQARLLIAPTAC